MKKFFNKLGFRKMDEMEQHIAFKAQRNALIFLLVALFVWTICEACKVLIHNTMLNPLPCILLTAATSIQLYSQLIMARNAVKDDEEYVATFPFTKIVICICVIVGIIVTVGAVMMIMGIGE